MDIAVIFAIAAVLTLSTTASAEMSGDVVKIGVLTDMSGLYADIGGPGSVEAARMAIADFGGSVNGKKIELISADHQNKPDVGSAIATQWFGSDGVGAIVDVPNSSVALAVQEVARTKNKVLLISGAAASDLTGKACSPTSVHWTYDTLSLANGTGAAIVKAGGDTWFFITADYAFGHNLERDTSRVVEEYGGQVLGSVLAPLNTADFSFFLLQAQNSQAKIIGLANAGADTIDSIKQAGEFGIVEGGQKLAGLLIFISDIQ
jgi:branched-chain amino acid transport system substrate-binding protein